MTIQDARPASASELAALNAFFRLPVPQAGSAGRDFSAAAALSADMLRLHDGSFTGAPRL